MGTMQEVLPKKLLVCRFKFYSKAENVRMEGYTALSLKGQEVIYLPLPMFICNTEFDPDAGDIIA